MTTDTGSPVHLVLGATGGIGSELCRRLADGGARLVLAARDEGKLTKLAGELGGQETIALDLREPEAAAAAVARTLAAHDRLDGLAHCVGSILLKPAHSTSDEEWRETLAINLDTAFRALRAAVKPMRKEGGAILFHTTAAARVGLVNHEAIAAAKAGLIGLARSAAATYARFGIRVNCIAPGLVRTPLSARITGSEASRKASLAMHPLGRLGEAADVASLGAWLLDGRNAWITGQVIGLDGGLADLRGR